jgi:hypothetical protein
MSALKEISDYNKVVVVMDYAIFGFFETEVKTLLVQSSKLNTWTPISDILRAESVEESAQRMLSQFPGLKASHLEQLGVHVDFNRQGEQRVVVISMCVIIRPDETETGANQPGRQWFGFHDLPSLDDRFITMFSEAKKRLREKSYVFSIMAPLFPQKFTVIQLQHIYESIYEMRLDKGNFAKRLLSANILKRRDEKNVMTSRKGSFYYEFNSENLANSFKS